MTENSPGQTPYIDNGFSKAHHITWWAIPLRGGDMLRINEYRYYELGSTVHPLTDIKDGADYHESLILLWGARIELDSLIANIPIRVCRPAAEEVLRAINAVVPKVSRKPQPLIRINT